MQQPFFGKQADIQIDPVQRPQRTHRIRPILQDPHRGDGALGRVVKSPAKAAVCG